MSRWLLNISKGGDSTTLLDDLCQCLVTLTEKWCFLVLSYFLFSQRGNEAERKILNWTPLNTISYAYFLFFLFLYLFFSPLMIHKCTFKKTCPLNRSEITTLPTNIETCNDCF